MDRVRSSVPQEELGVESLLLLIERNQMPPGRHGGVPGMSHWEETSRKTQDALKGLRISAGLGTLWGPVG